MTTARQPKGVPVGGQFAATAHAEPEGAQLVGLKIGEPREMTREELVMTGQAVDGNPAMSEITRLVQHQKRIRDRAQKAIDETMLNSAIIRAQQMFPGAKDLRLEERMGPGYVRYLAPSAITTADGERLEVDPRDITDSWAYANLEGAEPANIAAAIAGISTYTEVWRTDKRTDYDPQTEETVIYLDGRRRLDPS
jgi:hypothetical protein